MRAALIQPVHDAFAHAEPEHLEAGAGELEGERQADVAQPHDADQGRAILRLGDQDVGSGGGSSRHRVTRAPPAASERGAAASTPTTRTPSSAPARGGSAPAPPPNKWASAPPNR